MKKTRLLPLLILTLVCLCTAAFAAEPTNPVYIGSITDSAGNTVSGLTDDSTNTTWTKQSSGYGADLTIHLYSTSVGEIWIRNGHYYSQNYYNHYDRPEVISVTLWYNTDYYTSTSATYRYRMSDSYRPGTTSNSWYNGYQRILLPQRMNNVTRIELTIDSVKQGYGRTGATITDVIVASGAHATATPYTRPTATPKPYVQYVTPTPTPYVHLITPTPTRGVVFLTPAPTNTPPLVELITPVPVTTLPGEQPMTTRVPALLLKTAATRSGPSNKYDEPGSFFNKGDEIYVLSKSWDPENELWWFQIEFNYRGELMRAYTPENRIALDPDLVPTENDRGDAREVLVDHRVYFGPGEHYRMYKVSMLYKESRALIYGYEEVDGVLWAQIHYHDYAIDEDRRGWVPAEVLSDWNYPW